MNRFVSALKRFAELYLIIVGGACTLTGTVAFALNAHSMITATDPSEIAGYRADVQDNLLIIIFAGLAFMAGLGIHKYRPWGLLLAFVVGVLAIAEAISASAIDPWEYHNFTIALPLTVILAWTLLPPTWQEFRRRSSKSQ